MGLVKNTYQFEYYFLKDDGIFPNNAKLPVLIYKSVLNVPALFPFLRIRNLFQQHGWGNAWKGGVHNYHHYHSNTPEVLAVISGKTVLMLGGDKGISVPVLKGDVIVIPPGVAHKNLFNENKVTCIGAYPMGKDYDMYYGKTGERPLTDHNIEVTPLPDMDPVLGGTGKTGTIWRKP